MVVSLTGFSSPRKLFFADAGIDWSAKNRGLNFGISFATTYRIV